jgi:hypothetical protein
MSSITCPKCGTENPEDAVVCSGCKVSLSYALESAAESEQMKQATPKVAGTIKSEQPAAADAATPKEKTETSWLGCLVTIIVVVLIVWAGIRWFGSKFKEQQEELAGIQSAAGEELPPEEYTHKLRQLVEVDGHVVLLSDMELLGGKGDHFVVTIEVRNTGNEAIEWPLDMSAKQPGLLWDKDLDLTVCGIGGERPVSAHTILPGEEFEGTMCGKGLSLSGGSSKLWFLYHTDRGDVKWEVNFSSR